MTTELHADGGASREDASAFGVVSFSTNGWEKEELEKLREYLNEERQRDAVEACVESLGDRYTYFDRNAEGYPTTFVPPRLAAAIEQYLRLTRGPGNSLWYDAGGVYRPGAEDLVGDVVR